MLFHMLVTMRPHGGDLIRRIGRLSWETTNLLAKGINPRGNIAELAELAMTFKLGAVS